MGQKYSSDCWEEEIDLPLCIDYGIASVDGIARPVGAKQRTDAEVINEKDG